MGISIVQNLSMSYSNAIRCTTQLPSSPRSHKTSNMMTKLPNSCNIALPDLQVNEVAVRQSLRSPATCRQQKMLALDATFLEEAYGRCRGVCAEYAKTFYLGTQLMTEERQRAIWAIYVWCRRTDDLVDGPNSVHTNKIVLDRWEERLEEIFQGRPYDMFDAALTDTVFKFPIDIKPFKDMIEGMRMDTMKWRYLSFQELYLYCYYVAGTVSLMSVPVMGIAPESHAPVHRVYNSAVNLGIGMQLTNILRDVGEDASRGRIYLPQDELAQFGLSDEDVFSGKVSNRWRVFMKEQISRARLYFDQAEEGASQLNEASRWPVWASLLLYRKILDSIEENDYDNLNKRAYVGRAKKFLMLPWALARAANIQNIVQHKNSH